MNQFGMQMPGGRVQQSAGPDVFTALMFVGTVAMLAAVVMLWLAAAKVSPSGSPFEVQEKGAGKVKIKAPT